jgi:Zn-dependent protease with chaperone function
MSAAATADTVSPLSGWAIGVAANKDTLERSVRRPMWEAALAGGAIALLSLMMAGLIARIIARPIETLEKSAGAADKPEGLRSGGTGVPEIDRAIHARLVAESRLQESQPRLRLAVTSAAMGIHIWHVDFWPNSDPNAPASGAEMIGPN